MQAFQGSRILHCNGSNYNCMGDELVNTDPYGGGWLLDLQVEADALEKGFAELLDAEAYRSTLAE